MYELPEIKRKRPRPAHKKSDAIRLLERMANADAQRKHPNINPRFLAPRKYEDRTANGLTKCVIDFIRLSGFQAERISCTGRRQDNTQIIEDVLDRHRVIGSVAWIPTSGQRGTADVSATIRGRSVKLEIKAGKDKQRPDQVEYKRQIEAAGGIYLLIHNFTEFFEWFNQL